MITVLELLEEVGNFQLDLSYDPVDQDKFVLTVRGTGKTVEHPKNMSSGDIQFYLTLLLRDELIRGQKYLAGNFGQLSINISGLQKLEELRDQTGIRQWAAWLKSATGVLITHVIFPMLVALATIVFVDSRKSSFDSSPIHEPIP